MMDEEECLKPDSDFPPKKHNDDGIMRGRRQDDRISELPDEIIITILSFLSVREAAATSFLSPRWSDLWKHTPLLKFKADSSNRSHVEGSSWDVEKCKYIQLVNTVLQLHKAPSLKTFRIAFYVNKSAKSAVAKWLEFVFSRQVESLELEFRCYQALYKVVLEELLRESSICPQTDVLIMFKSLKHLTLKCVKLSGEDIKLFLRNCPLLEQLKIISSTFTSDIFVCGCGTTLMLKHLDIRWCNGEKSIKVSVAPNLTSICVDRISGNLSIEKVPKLVHVRYGNNKRQRHVDRHFASAVYSIISQLQKLILILYRPKEFLANGVPKMPKLDMLVVHTAHEVYKQDGLLPTITALIRASPCLQHFVLKFLGDPKDVTSHMEVIENVRRSCGHQHLKIKVL